MTPSLRFSLFVLFLVAIAATQFAVGTTFLASLSPKHELALYEKPFFWTLANWTVWSGFLSLLLGAFRGSSGRFMYCSWLAWFLGLLLGFLPYVLLTWGRELMSYVSWVTMDGAAVFLFWVFCGPQPHSVSLADVKRDAGMLR